MVPIRAMKRESGEIPREEGYLVEFKDFRGGVSVKELSKTLCAFANTEGGAIYLGVTDGRQIHGIGITPPLLDHIQNAAREGCIPSVPISLAEIAAGERKVLRIAVEKSGRLHSVSAGQTYIRVGTQDKRIVGEELLRLAESKSQSSFEDHLLPAGVEAVDANALNEYSAARRSTLAMRGELGTDDLLVKMGLARREGGQFHIAAGAIVLFGKEDERLFLQRDFTFVRYDAEGKMYAYREDISLPAGRLLNRLLELIRPFNRFAEGPRGMTRQERFLYPEEAIREALVNAVAHRDYRISGLRNECRWYPDRLEIISAGSLPNFITIENIDQRHYSRNPKIMHALMILGLVEELGQGVSLMKRSLKANGNPPPEFAASPDQFKVTFFRPRGSTAEDDIRKRLDAYFSAHPMISRRQIEAIFGLGTTTAKYLVDELLKKGYLVRRGRGPATKYERSS